MATNPFNGLYELSPEYPRGFNSSLSFITPFTHRTNISYAELLFELYKWLREQHLPELDEFLTNWQNQYKEDFEALKNDINSTKDDWQALFDQFMADIVNQLEALNDQAVSNLIGNKLSLTRSKLNNVITDSLGYVNFSDYAPASGSVHSALTIAVNDAISQNRDLYIPAGRYYLPSVFTKTISNGLRIYGDGSDKTIFYAEPDNHMFDLNGGGIDLLSTVSLVDSVSSGGLSLTVGDSSGFKPGDWINIQSNRVWVGSTLNARYGELIQIRTVPNSTTIILKTPVRYSHSTSDVARISVVALGKKLRIEGIGFENSSMRSGTSGAVALTAFDAPEITDVRGEGLDGAFFTITACVNANIDGLRAVDLADDEANSRFGYGVNIGPASLNTKINNAHGVNVRHLVTTSSGSNSPYGGVPINSLITNSSGSGGTNFIFSTHVEGDSTTFVDCIVYDTFEGGFEMRAPRSNIIRPVIKNVIGPAIFLQQTAFGSEVHDAVIENVSSELSARGLAGFGLWITAPRCIVDGFRIENTGDSSILVSSTSPSANELIIRRGQTFNPGTAGANPHAIRFNGASARHIIENIFVNNTAVTNGGSAINATGVVLDTIVNNVRTRGTGVLPFRGIANVDVLAGNVLGDYVANTMTGHISTATSTFATSYDSMVSVTDTTDVRTITLPLAQSVSRGHKITVKDESGLASIKNIVIARSGANVIDGVVSIPITTNYGSKTLYSDGVSKWFTV